MKCEQKKRIVFLLPDTNVGGAETVCVNLLNSLDLNKYVPTLIVIRQTGNLLNRLNENVRVVDLGCRSTKGAFFKLLNKIRQLKPDVVFTTHSRTALISSVVSIFLKKFVLVSRMQSSPQAEKDHNEYGWIQRCLYSWSFNRAKFLIAQTEEMRSEAIKVFGLKGDKIIVAYNPIRTEVTSRTENSKIRHLMNDEDYNIVAAGSISPVKDFKTLISAFSISKASMPKAKLFILGRDGDDAQAVRELINVLDLSNDVKLLGHVADPVPFFANCDLFVLSSIYEGCPNVLLENFVLNTPLIATRCCGMVSRLISEGKNGFTVSVKNIDELAVALQKAYFNLRRSEISNEWPSNKSLTILFNNWIFDKLDSLSLN